MENIIKYDDYEIKYCNGVTNVESNGFIIEQLYGSQLDGSLEAIEFIDEL